MTTQLPPPLLEGTYTQRVAYSTSLIIPGQVWRQTDTATDAGTTYLLGYYYWTGTAWAYDTTQAMGGQDIDGRGQNTGAGGASRINNSDNNTTWITANPTSAPGYTGLWYRLASSIGFVIGMFVSNTDFTTSIRTALGSVLGLWSTNTFTGASLRMLDLGYNVGSNGRHTASLRFGAGGIDTNYGQIPCHYGVTLAEVANSGSSETDAETIPLPANALAGGNQAIDIFVWGVCAANANAKRARLAFGSTIIADTTSIVANGKRWKIHAKIYRTGSNAQKYFSESGFGSSAPEITDGTATETETGAINLVVKLTGAASNDIYVKGFETMPYN